MTQRRVLVVDDDDAIRTLVKRVLQREGFTVEAAFDGADAITKLGESTYDLLILDLMMPRVDGFAVIQHIASSDGAKPRIVVMTATSPQVLSRVPREQVFDILTKPFNIENLIESAHASLVA